MTERHWAGMSTAPSCSGAAKRSCCPDDGALWRSYQQCLPVHGARCMCSKPQEQSAGGHMEEEKAGGRVVSWTCSIQLNRPVRIR